MVVATVTTLRDPAVQDASCVLREGDHPFIRHDSILDFGGAVAMHKTDILCKQYKGDFTPKEDLAPEVFERVLNAAKASRDMRRRIKSMLFSAL